MVIIITILNVLVDKDIFKTNSIFQLHYCKIIKQNTYLYLYWYPVLSNPIDFVIDVYVICQEYNKN